MRRTWPVSGLVTATRPATRPIVGSRIRRAWPFPPSGQASPEAPAAEPTAETSGRCDVQRPTIEDVAQFAGVSRGTVSRVLNGGRHVRPAVVAIVNSAIETLGYSVNQAARNLAAGRTGSVAFVVSEHQEHIFEDPNYVLFVSIFGRELRRQGRHLLLTAAEDTEEEIFIGDYLSAGHVDGALLALPHADEPLLARLAQSRLPLVVIGRPLGYEGELSWVAIDDGAAAYEIVSYLVGRGLLAHRHRHRPAQYQRRTGPLRGLQTSGRPAVPGQPRS